MARRVLLADDHPLFREALGATLRRIWPQIVVDEVSCLSDAVGALDKATTTYELVLLDLKLPDCDGFGGLLAIRSAHPETAVAIVSAREDSATISDAIACGACGFIPKSSTSGRLREALEAILAGDLWTPDASVAIPTEAIRIIASLSPAQRRILSGLRRGLLNKQIAHEIGVTEATVKAHMTGLFRKLGVSNRTQALIFAQALDSDVPGI